MSTSACGNFAAVGRSDGTAAYYNMQSGRLRKPFGKGGSSSPAWTYMQALLMLACLDVAHDGMVTGIAMDALNTLCLTIGTDCKLKASQL